MNLRPLSPLPLDRRSFLRVAAGGVLGAPALVGRAAGEERNWPANPFALGVAAGSPAPDGFVIWTRLAPEPLSADPDRPGGMTPEPVSVAYEIAADPALGTIVQRGTAVADPALAHSVHVEVAGLEPGRPYWYRFLSGDAASRMGRATTLPHPGAEPARLRLGFVSCSNYEHGYFSAYRHLADESPDLVLFLGDYIYEGVDTRPGMVRTHAGGEARTLSGYRNRYAQYRLDPDLQRLHAEVPALVTWDDHEVHNDYADRWSQTFDDPEVFLRRRAAAYQAYYEHMPLRPSLSRPRGAAMRLHDRFAFGDLVEIAMLDGRQYRSRVACYGPPNKGGGRLETDETCPERRDESRSLLGFDQERWLFDGLSRSRARWNLIGQDVLMTELGQSPAPGISGYWTDSWDGYPAARARLLGHVAESRVRNPVVLSGDIHSFWANDLRLRFDDPASPIVATELVATSVTSRPPPYEMIARELPKAPQVRYFESRHRGYSTLDIGPGRMTVTLRAVSDVREPAATVSTLKSFVVEDGRPGAQDA